ncbi:hypothetical protein WN51_00400 [Melipona quadrifasciata]|uniref:PiggyBac transposable element-derived protein domain-containing protein n=1 Tax=Melipona quadrifasciata TaxID=166423 RepID=A0A0M9A2V2_9HYME|nr:hypothetical protein WN51_00400 [Melipona quadrifasciata]
MIPWRGRLKFRQYIPIKSHKCGIKLFKLCCTEGYTWSAKIYAGRDTSEIRQVGIAEGVCIELADKLLNERKNQQGKPIKRMCVLCYQKKRQIFERQEARKNVKETTTYCQNRPKLPQMYLNCFNKYHTT